MQGNVDSLMADFTTEQSFPNHKLLGKGVNSHRGGMNYPSPSDHGDYSVACELLDSDLAQKKQQRQHL